MLSFLFWHRFLGCCSRLFIVSLFSSLWDSVVDWVCWDARSIWVFLFVLPASFSHLHLRNLHGVYHFGIQYLLRHWHLSSRIDREDVPFVLLFEGFYTAWMLEHRTWLISSWVVGFFLCTVFFIILDCSIFTVWSSCWACMFTTGSTVRCLILSWDTQSSTGLCLFETCCRIFETLLICWVLNLKNFDQTSLIDLCQIDRRLDQPSLPALSSRWINYERLHLNCVHDLLDLQRCESPASRTLADLLLPLVACQSHDLFQDSFRNTFLWDSLSNFNDLCSFWEFEFSDTSSRLWQSAHWWHCLLVRDGVTRIGSNCTCGTSTVFYLRIWVKAFGLVFPGSVVDKWTCSCRQAFSLLRRSAFSTNRLRHHVCPLWWCSAF